MIKTFYLLIILCSFSFSQRANFFKEDITFRLDSMHLNVEGYYWFSNISHTSIATEMFYPFPYTYGDTIDSIRIYNISIGQKHPFKLEGCNGISFYLFIAPHDTVIFQIGYRQKLISDSAVYLLKTTQNWGKPLAHAEYKLLVTEPLVIKHFSYPPTKSYEIQNEKIYYWEMNDFMPDHDMLFCF
jgi:hypothetical protein